MKDEATILIVEDEDDLRKVLDFNLTDAGYRTVAVATGAQAVSEAKKFVPDLVLLDYMLPDISGTDVCRSIKADPATANVPVVFLTARGEEIDRVSGFEVGAEDYVVKPFSVRELLLRIKAILKRTASVSEVSDGEELRFGPIAIDIARHRAFMDEQEIELTATEFKLLVRFLKNLGHVQSRDMLLERVWGSDINVTARTVDTHVKRLREKLGDNGRYIETVRGVGYRFAERP